MSATVRAAAASDYEGVVGLLRAADLPTAGLRPPLPDFLVADEGGRLVGAIGLEVYGDSALLRSAVCPVMVVPGQFAQSNPPEKSGRGSSSRNL